MNSAETTDARADIRRGLIEADLVDCMMWHRNKKPSETLQFKRFR